MAEGVPADAFVNVVCFRNRPDMALHQIVRPVWLLPPHGLTGKDIIVINAQTRYVRPLVHIFLRREQLYGVL